MKQIAMTFAFFLFSIFTFAQSNPIVPKGPITTMEFEVAEFDFGVVTEGEKVSYTYKFKNTGTEPLLIKDAKGSCGCTVPSWPKVPLAPGETAEILVEFNTKGKSGQQAKRVTITANTDPAQSFLMIKGEVLKAGKIDGNPFTIMPKVEEPTPTVEPSEAVTELPGELKKLKAKDCFAIFPNPTTDFLKLELKEHVGEKASIRIFDSKGTMLKLKEIDEIAKQVLEFDVSNYPNGTYYVYIQMGDHEPSTKCFVVAGK